MSDASTRLPVEPAPRRRVFSASVHDLKKSSPKHLSLHYAETTLPVHHDPSDFVPPVPERPAWLLDVYSTDGASPVVRGSVRRGNLSDLMTLLSDDNAVDSLLSFCMEVGALRVRLPDHSSFFS